MAHLLTNVAFTLVLAQAGSKGIGPSPPPNRFDPEHDAQLLGPGKRVAGETENIHQRPPIRLLRWRVRIAESTEVHTSAIHRHIVQPANGLRDKYSWKEMTLSAARKVRPFSLAETNVHVSEEQVRFLRAPGVQSVFVNGEGFVGDPSRRGDLGVPVLLQQGDNRILLSGFDGGLLEVELWDPVPRLVAASWAVELKEEGWPDVLAVPVFNADSQPATNIHFHYGRAHFLDSGLAGLGEWVCGGFTAPLGLIYKRSYLWSHDQTDVDLHAPGVVAQFSVYEGTGGVADRRLLSLENIGVDRSTEKAQFWPADSIDTTSLLVYETSGPEDFAREALAVARFCQQLIWYRTGEIPALVSDTFLATEKGQRRYQMRQNNVVRFGHLDTDEEGVLTIDVESLSIRASDAVAMRLVYVVDPFFTELDMPARLHVYAWVPSESDR